MAGHVAEHLVVALRQVDVDVADGAGNCGLERGDLVRLQGLLVHREAVGPHGQSGSERVYEDQLVVRRPEVVDRDPYTPGVDSCGPEDDPVVAFLHSNEGGGRPGRLPRAARRQDAGESGPAEDEHEDRGTPHERLIDLRRCSLEANGPAIRPSRESRAAARPKSRRESDDTAGIAAADGSRAGVPLPSSLTGTR